jgi:hypothetical protein
MPKRAKKGQPSKLDTTPRIKRELRADSLKRPIIYTCPSCGKEVRNLKNDFYVSNSPLYAYSKSIPICKACVNRLYQQYVVQYQDEDLALRMVCMQFDIYYSDRLAASTTDAKGNRIGQYISSLTVSGVNASGKTYVDTLLEDENSFINTPKEEDTIGGGSKILKRTVDMFGEGFSDEDYKFLQKQYDDWVRRCGCETKPQEELYKSICYTQLKLYRAELNGEDTKDLNKTFQDSLASLGLKPTQNKGIDTTSSQYSLGQLIEQWENDKPIDKVDPEFEDVDGIRKNVFVWFFGHLAKMVGIENKYSKLYDEEVGKYTVTKPEYNDDSAALYEKIFGSEKTGGD